MNTELYQKLFNKLDSLGAIRKDLTFGCEVILTSTGGSNRKATVLEIYPHYSKYLSKSGILSNNNANRRFKQSWETKEIIGHPLVLSDVIEGVDEATKEWMYLRDTAENVLYEIISKWDLSKPLLSNQSDELGEYLLTLLG